MTKTKSVRDKQQRQTIRQHAAIHNTSVDSEENKVSSSVNSTSVVDVTPLRSNCGPAEIEIVGEDVCDMSDALVVDGSAINVRP